MPTGANKNKKDMDMDKISDFVDRLVKDDYLDCDINLFWKQVFEDVTMQQTSVVH